MSTALRSICGIKAKPFLILQTGNFSGHMASIEVAHGDMAGIFVNTCGLQQREHEVVRVHQGELCVDPPDHYAGILVTGSPHMVSSLAPWMKKSAHWLRRAFETGVPILGVCFGHQLLAHALGGRIGTNPNGLEAGTITVHFNAGYGEDPLFGVLPKNAHFNVHHHESVLDLPNGAQVLGWNDHDAHQAIRYGERAWGIQFHPEIRAQIMRDILAAERSLRKDLTKDKGIEQLVHDTPEGPRLLARFTALCREYS